MKRIASVLISVVLLLSITVGITLSAYAMTGVNPNEGDSFEPLSDKYVIGEDANQFDFYEVYDTIENLKLWASGAKDSKGNYIYFSPSKNLIDVCAKKLGILDTNLKDYEKIAKIYYYLSFTYVPSDGSAHTDDNAYFLRRGHCEVFARTFMALCDRAGIECWMVGNGGHAWNVVKLGGKYYECDAMAGANGSNEDFLVAEFPNGINNARNVDGSKYYNSYSSWLSAIGGSSKLATSAYKLPSQTANLALPKVTATATNEGIVVKWNAVSNADWYEVYTAPFDGILTNVSRSTWDSSTNKVVEEKYNGDFLYYIPPVSGATLSFHKVKTIHSIDKNENGGYQCFLENGDSYGMIVVVVAQNVNGGTSIKTTGNAINKDNVAELMPLIGGKNYLTPASSGTDKNTGKIITNPTAVQLNDNYYAIHKKTSSGHSYSKVKTVRAAGAGTQGADLYECKNCLQRQIRYTAAKSLATPKLSSVANTATGVKITWGKVSGAAKYRVFYKANGESTWHKAGDTTSTSYTWTKAKSGTKYAFTVRCVDKDGKNYTSSYNSTGKSIKYIAAPKLSSVSNTATGIKISWGKVAGAAKYRIFYKANGEKTWHKAGDTASTSYTWTKAKSGTKYTFTVRCIDKNGNYTSSYNSTGKSIKYIAAPKIKPLSKTSSGIKISWNKVTGAEKYRIFYKTGNGSWKKLTDTTSTSYTWKGGKKGTTYTFTVRCVDKNGKTYTSAYDSKGKSIKNNDLSGRNCFSSA